MRVYSDQVFYMIQGTMLAYSGGELRATLHEGDAVLVPAGEPHAVTNREDRECIYLALTTPPLEQAH